MRPLLTALVGPVAFLVLLVGFSAYFVRGGPPSDPQEVAEWVTGKMGIILLLVQVALATTAFWLWRSGAVATTLRQPAWPWPRAVVIGVLFGAGLFAAYALGIERLLVALQARLGDYVSSGTVVDRISRPLSLFFLANCVLAPVAEELIYRGHVLPRLAERWGWWPALVLSAVLFGMLHWAGGLWYMAATALLVGLPLGLLFLRSGVLALPLAAHLSLNLLEFGLAFRRHW
ncbi:CPBP family intramembrane glutamic endopeptidase [Hyalangium versicolor]|uniref:CPBP family intramembrane glutamic endopeptidase n=1 Tax=Hyalangium versicolor TaxID=2861190 RepID=UPI001CCF5F6E|nr:type II CAAX endopeptidase family protein [Hyalangium versicolor]